MKNLSNALSITIVSLILALVSGCASQAQQVPMMNAGMPVAFPGGPAGMAPMAQVTENEAFLGRPISTCASGPLKVELKNETDQWVAAQIDGLDVAIIGARGQIPVIGPHQSSFLCLDNVGQHSVGITKYVANANRQLIQMGTTDTTSITFSEYHDHLVRIQNTGLSY